MRPLSLSADKRMRIISSISKRKLIIEKEAGYFSLSGHGCIEVKDTSEFGAPVRLLLVNGVRESAAYLIPGLQYEPVFGYIRVLLDIFEHKNHLKTALLIGGAGFSLPKAFISRYGDKSMDVVENNPDMIDIAKKYFFLNRLIEEFELEKNKRMQIIIGDGCEYLENGDKEYDIIINDAFVGSIPDKGLMSKEGQKLINKRLTKGGIYVINVIASLIGKDSAPLMELGQTLSSVFGNVRIRQVSEDYPAELKQNVIVISEKG